MMKTLLKVVGIGTGAYLILNTVALSYIGVGEILDNLDPYDFHPRDNAVHCLDAATEKIKGYWNRL